MGKPEPGLPGGPGGGLPALLVRRLLGWMVALVLAFMMALTVVDVTGRFVFNRPIPGSFEVMEFCLAIVVFSALPLVTWDRRHITVSLFDSLFRGSGDRLRQGVIQLASLLGIGIVCWRMLDPRNRQMGVGVGIEKGRTPNGYMDERVYSTQNFSSCVWFTPPVRETPPPDP